MVKDDRTHSERLAAKARAALLMSIVACILVVCASGFLAAHLLLQPTTEEGTPTNTRAESAPPTYPGLFRDWPKPDVAVVLSAQQYGYLQPCGCSEPQKGGLARRFNLVQ